MYSKILRRINAVWISLLVVWITGINWVYASMPDYITVPLSKKYSEIEKLDKEVEFTKNWLDVLSKLNPGLFTLNKKWMVFNPIVETDLVELAKEYKKDNKISLRITSAYRWFEEQKRLYNNYVKTGRSAYSTYAWTSEHHLWTTFDFGLGWSQAKYKWLEDNSRKYWFLRSYTKECESISGIKPEEWHYRWVWKKLAKEYMDIKAKQDLEWNKNYCPLSFFRFKSWKWPTEK